MGCICSCRHLLQLHQSVVPRRGHGLNWHKSHSQDFEGSWQELLELAFCVIILPESESSSSVNMSIAMNTMKHQLRPSFELCPVTVICSSFLRGRVCCLKTTVLVHYTLTFLDITLIKQHMLEPGKIEACNTGCAHAACLVDAAAPSRNRTTNKHHRR